MLRNPSLATWINAAEWSHPVYKAESSDPVLPIYREGKVVATIHVPKGARPALPTFAQNRDTDAHLHIVEPSGRYVHEMWRARLLPDRIVADGYTRSDLQGPGVGQGGERAYGGSALGGLILASELSNDKGAPHALAAALPRRYLRLGPVWPATTEDAFAKGSYKGPVPMGTRFALPRDLPIDRLGLSSMGKALAQTLSHYGAFVVDAAGDFSLYAEPAMEESLETLRRDLALLRPYFHCVKTR